MGPCSPLVCETPRVAIDQEESSGVAFAAPEAGPVEVITARLRTSPRDRDAHRPRIPRVTSTEDRPKPRSFGCFPSAYKPPLVVPGLDKAVRIPAVGGTSDERLNVMKMTDLGRSSANVELTRAELILVNNALNEVCNGVTDLSDDEEFTTRLGASRSEARALLGSLSDLIKRADALPG